MTLTQLKYVLAIAKAGTINAAAKQLFISQPTLSSAVKELEAELGISLFNRTSKGVEPTADAQTLAVLVLDAICGAFASLS